MGSVVSALAFPAPNKAISEAALLKRDAKKQLVYLTTKSGYKIPAIHIRKATSPQHESTRLTLLYSHGNAEDVGLALHYLDSLSHFCDCNVLAYEYCGYSLAEGEPSEENCYECIQTAYDFLTQDKRIPPSQIVLFGRSLGTGPTVNLAAKLCQKISDGGGGERIAGCVLQSPLESAGRCVLGQMASFFLYPLDIFRSYENIEHLAPLPVLFLHGLADRVVPAANGQALYRTWHKVALPTAHVDAKACQPLWIPDADHNDMPEFMCMQTVCAFLDYLKSVNFSSEQEEQSS